jgi:transcriptional regulator NrdR
MRCPLCQNIDTQVVETRTSENSPTVRRRRRCPQCDYRFTTYEHAEVNMPMVVKKNGNRVEFNPEKLRASFTLALRKRPVSADAVKQAIQNVEKQLLGSGLKEVPSRTIGEYVMKELAALDKIAFVRFASVYHSFEDVTEFEKIIQKI